MPAPISLDLRARIIAAWQSGEYSSWDEIAATFRVGRATVDRLIRLYRATNSVEPAPHGGGPEPLIPDEDLLRVWDLVEEQPDRTIDEFADEYAKRTGVRVSRATMGRALERLELSRKKRRSRPASGTARASSSRGRRS